MITQLFPILATHDLDRSLAFYRDLLGGTVTYEFPGGEDPPCTSRCPWVERPVRRPSASASNEAWRRHHVPGP